MLKLLSAPSEYTDLVSQCGCGVWDSLCKSAVETLDRDVQDGDWTGKQGCPWCCLKRWTYGHQG